MMQNHQAAASEQRASQAKLNDLVTSMKNATGDAKIDLMAQAITELANQHRAEMGLHDQMMQSMAECPMMQGGMMGGTMEHHSNASHAGHGATHKSDSPSKTE